MALQDPSWIVAGAWRVVLAAAIPVAPGLAAQPLPDGGTGWIEQKIAAGDGTAGNNFGYALAIDGACAIVGSYQSSVDGNMAAGAVYAYERIDGVWTETQKIVSGEPAPFAQFGEAIALQGDTLLVSANGVAVGGNGFAGAVYVFERAGGVWTQVQKLTASDAAGLDNFGWSVAAAGDVAVIGAPYADVAGHADQGAAYVFARADGMWSEVAKLASLDGAADDNFGRAVAVEDGTALVGAVGATIDGRTAQGAAYVFEASGARWTESRKLVASDGLATDNFGQAVALDGATALIGAPLAAKAYVFEHGESGWSESATLAAGDGPDLSRYFGYALDLDGTRAIVGAFDADIGENTFQGAAYVFDAADGAWSESAKLVASDGEARENFGIAVGVSGGYALAGAYYAHVGANPAQGAAYFYEAPTGDVIFADGFEAP